MLLKALSCHDSSCEPLGSRDLLLFNMHSCATVMLLLSCTNMKRTKVKQLSPMQVGVRATFFINSDNLHLDDPALVAQNKESLVRMVTEGHVVGDHSYDHMAHNTINDSPR